jgi:hypothetical protein
MHVCTYSTTRQVTATFSGSEGSGPLTRGPRLTGPTCQWPFSTPFSRPKPTERNFHDLKKNEVVPEIGWLGTYARTNGCSVFTPNPRARHGKSVVVLIDRSRRQPRPGVERSVRSWYLFK